MNLHHPSWDFNHLRDRGAVQLLYLATSWRLSLLTPPRATTRPERDNVDSTIDLIWPSDDI